MEQNIKSLRACVIGAGQSGMAALNYFAKLGQRSPEVVCYESTSDWAGQWKCPWRTDTDEYGVRVRSGMYRTMWINLPKESSELPHYTFDAHFGKATPSYFPAPVMRHYLEGYWKSSAVDLSKMITFNTPVTSVKYNDVTNDFTVVTRNTVDRRTNPPERYSHVIVASGIFAYPNAPEFKGFDTFPGRIMHSQQFRGGQDSKGKRVLVIGSYLSAEDVALQCYKHGASHVIITWKKKPMGYNFPTNIEERPLLQEVNGNIARFKDGSTAEIDTIVLCTGYKQGFSFLEDRLQLCEEMSVFFPDKLYKGMVWLGGGNDRLLYIGAQRHPLQIPMVDVQAAWIVRYVTGINPLNPEDTTPGGLNESANEVKQYVDNIRDVFSAIQDVGGILKATQDYLHQLADEVGYYIEIEKMTEMVVQCFRDRKEDLVGFRDRPFTSVYTGKRAAAPETKWIDAFGDHIEDYYLSPQVAETNNCI